MSTIKSLYDKVLQLNTDTIITEALKETTVDFEAENKIQMLMGLTNKGEHITPKYQSSKYAKTKKAAGSIPDEGTPDLFVTGEFQRLIDVEVGTDVLDIISKDEKGPELEFKYKNIFGLSGPYKAFYLENNLGPAIQIRISKILNLNFRQ